MDHRAREGAASYKCFRYSFVLLLISVLGALVSVPAAAQDKDDEIVATLTGGRVIMHATQESITFVALDEPLEAGSVPPRVMSVDGRHVEEISAPETHAPRKPLETCCPGASKGPTLQRILEGNKTKLDKLAHPD